MNVYPGVANIKPLARIRRERLLPRLGEVAVRGGQRVTPVQVVARMQQDTGFSILPAAEVLEVPATDLAQHLLVEVGAVVKKGTPILQQKGRFGRVQRLGAPVDGILHQVINGRLIFRRPPRLVELRALLQGLITSVVTRRGVQIEAYGSLIQGVWSTDAEGVGKLALTGDRPDSVLEPGQVGLDSRGQILVAGTIDRLETLQAAEENGVRGLLVGSMPARLCRSAEDLFLPIIVVDGIGRQGMNAMAYELLQQSVDREVTLFGTAQHVRYYRPEVIIALAAVQNAEPPAGPATVLAVGQTVRLRRAPHSGRLAVVTAIHQRSRLLPTGARMPGADVRLASGSHLFVPFANLEIVR